MLGKATGSAENIQRSQQMLSDLRHIGLGDTAEARALLKNHFDGILADPGSVTGYGQEGRIIRESYLQGPGGGLKLESIWEGNKLITVLTKSGKQ